MLDASIQMSPPFSARTIKENILTLLDKVPSENLLMVETFIRFMRDQQQMVTTSSASDQTLWHYPTVPPATVNLDNLVGIMSDVGGDALEDTESLYR